MTHQEYIDLQLQVATHLKDLAHTDEARKLFYNTDDLLESHQNNIGKDEFFMVLDDQNNGSYRYINESVLDFPSYGFWIMRRVDNGDYPDEEVCFSQAKAIGGKIYALYRKHLEEQSGVMSHFVPDSWNYRKEGPQIDQFFGAYFTFQVRDYDDSPNAYNPDDWTAAL